MANELNIFGGFYYLSLYDGTNGWQHMTQAVNVTVSDKPLTNKTIEGQIRVYQVEHKLTINLPESDQSTIDDLNTRVATKQDVYLIGMDHVLIFDDVYINPFVKRVEKGHVLTIEASTAIDADSIHRVNLLTNSDFEANDNSIATGWNGDETDMITSHTTGDAQEFTADAGSGYADNIYSDNNYMPLRNGQQVTISAYFKGDAGDSASVTFAMQVIAANGTTVLDTISVTETLTTAQETRLTASDTLSLADDACFFKIIVTLNTDERTISFDDMQIELSSISTYRNY